MIARYHEVKRGEVMGMGEVEMSILLACVDRKSRMISAVLPKEWVGHVWGRMLEAERNGDGVAMALFHDSRYQSGVPEIRMAMDLGLVDSISLVRDAGGENVYVEVGSEGDVLLTGPDEGEWKWGNRMGVGVEDLGEGPRLVLSTAVYRADRYVDGVCKVRGYTG